MTNRPDPVDESEWQHGIRRLRSRAGQLRASFQADNSSRVDQLEIDIEPSTEPGSGEAWHWHLTFRRGPVSVDAISGDGDTLAFENRAGYFDDEVEWDDVERYLTGAFAEFPTLGPR